VMLDLASVYRFHSPKLQRAGSSNSGERQE
jgi:hypothetical protein